MARTLYPAQVAQNYSEAKWSVADDNAQNETKPVAGDTIICTASSGKVTCDEPWAALALSATGACEWDFGAQAASVTNVITLDNMTVTTAAATITGDVNLGDVGGAGTLTMSDTLTIDGGFLLDGGTLTMAANKLSITGSYIKTSGTMVTPGELEMTGSGKNLNPGITNNPAALELGSIANINLAANGVFKSGMEIPSGSTLNLQGFELTLYRLAAGDQTDTLHCEGTITRTTGSINLRPGMNVSNGLVFNAPDIPVKFESWGVHTWTQTAAWTCSSLNPWDSSNAGAYTFSIDGASLTVGAVTLGKSAAVAGSGGLNLGSGVHSITSVAAGNAANSANALDFGTSTTTVTSAFDTSNIKTISSGACILTFTGGLTIDSTATNNTTWTLAGDTRINGNITLKQTAGTTELDLAGYRLTLRGGDTFTHTAGTLTSGGGSIIANGQTLTNITADAEILVYGGIDGGGNTNLTFVGIISGASSAASPEVGCGNTYGMAELGLGGVH